MKQLRFKGIKNKVQFLFFIFLIFFGIYFVTWAGVYSLDRKEDCPYSSSSGLNSNTKNAKEEVQCLLKPEECSGGQRAAMGIGDGSDEERTADED